jgi:hypothetical protein
MVSPVSSQSLKTTLDVARDIARRSDIIRQTVGNSLPVELIYAPPADGIAVFVAQQDRTRRQSNKHLKYQYKFLCNGRY